MPTLCGDARRDVQAEHERWVRDSPVLNLQISTSRCLSSVVLGLDTCKNRSEEVNMSDIEDCKTYIQQLQSAVIDANAMIATLRDQLEEWKAIVANQEGKIGRALGLAEGAVQTQGLLNKSFDARISSLESARTPLSAVGINPFATSVVAET